ncbi:HvfC/BufC family peptide modification chaperone [Echinimonas agarilytica]|uniref:DNA-binding domain-containing protein n=1 Tax=Echinimonas agarilytica TaxID=1215918 RepID=A0AA42B6W5_9GAMM|nr:putative DNA-binding domain-containing protein [Echinimonas agarilytica]MCM2679150.1 putative DNA-binding domain-containing protein [Echinimonas agarilytica]
MDLRYEQSIHDFEHLLNSNDSSIEQYQANYAGAHIAALKSIFATTQYILSPPIFLALCKVYSEHFPTSDWDINRYGKHFAHLLTSQQQSSKSVQFPWLDLGLLATFEYCIGLCYYPASSDASKVLINAEIIQMLRRRHDWLVQLKHDHNYLEMPFSIEQFGAGVLVQRDYKIALTDW